MPTQDLLFPRLVLVNTFRDAIISHEAKYTVPKIEGTRIAPSRRRQTGAFGYNRARDEPPGGCGDE